MYCILRKNIRITFRHTFVSIQLFRERLSYKQGKAYATMSKVIMGNGGFYGYFREPQGVSVLWNETVQTRFHFFSFLVTESPWSSIKQSQTLTTHNANRHCRVRFYTFVGQPLSKQLYTFSYLAQDWRFCWQWLPYELSSAVQHRKSAAKWLNSGFAADLQRLGSLFAAKVKLQRAAETLCSPSKHVAVFSSCSAARR